MHSCTSRVRNSVRHWAHWLYIRQSSGSSELQGVRKAEQDLLERTEMRMLRWMMGIKRIENMRTECLRARSGVANESEKIREARLRLLGYFERNIEDVVMRELKMEVGGYRNMGRQKLR